ncbi:MAG: KilA-N domain-containing protein [Bacteroidota bacterium]
MSKKSINVSGLTIRLSKVNDEHFINITDLAKKRSERPAITIQSWMHGRPTIDFLKSWELINNPNFKVTPQGDFKGFEAVKDEFITSGFVMYPSKWIEYTNAIGFKVKRGKYGGTWAHEDIALEFASWLSPEFKLFVITEFKRLKTDEQLRLGDPLNIKRYLTAGTYSVLVNSLLSKMDERLLTHPQPYKKRLPFAAEADMINEIIFGITAKQWRSNNSKAPANRNQRDYATVLELVLLNCLEVVDAMLIQWDVEDLKERRNFLQETYDFFYPTLKRSKTIQELQKLADKANP